MITTNGEPSETRVKIEADVTLTPGVAGPIAFSPYRLDFRDYEPESGTTELTFTLVNSQVGAMPLELTDAPSDLIEVHIPASLSAHDSATAAVVLTAEGRRQSFERSFTLQTWTPELVRFTIPVTHSIRSDSAAAKPSLPADCH